MEIFIQAAEQISIQEPLCESWFDTPIYPSERYNQAIDPDYKQFLDMMKMRRAGKLLKRALTTSLVALKKAEIEKTDAIITGTGLGCAENTEKFFVSIFDNDEQFLQPTFFMQSTHNTISSQISLYTKNNGYNNTYSHNGTSFDNALLDAVMQFELGNIANALVGSHEELTPLFFSLFDKRNYWKKGEINTDILRKSDSYGAVASECSVSFALENCKKQQTICKLQDVKLLFKPSENELQKGINAMLEKAGLQINDLSAVVLGYNGDKDKDLIYNNLHKNIFTNTPAVWYKHIFGESFSASATGLYTAACCLQKAKIPQHLLYNKQAEIANPQHILIYNHTQNNDHSLILISKA